MQVSQISQNYPFGNARNTFFHVQGGFRLEVLDPKERPIRDLTPKTGEDEFLRGDPTALNYAAQLPADLECVNCTIRQVPVL